MSEPVEPSSVPLTEPLLPAACCEAHPCETTPSSCAEDPTWAIIHRSDEVWLRRARAAGLVDVEVGEVWVLLGPSP